MIPLTITLEASDGTKVKLLAGKAASWPEQSDFKWCGTDDDGKPMLHAGKFALHWAAGMDGSVVCEVDWTDTEVVETAIRVRAAVGLVASRHRNALNHDNQCAVEEAAIDFEQTVTRALGDAQALRPFADLERARIAAHNHLMAAWQRLPVAARANWAGGLPGALAALYEAATAVGALRRHVAQVLEDAALAATKRAAVAFEAAGGVYPGSGVTGSEATNIRSVPNEVLAQAEREMAEPTLEDVWGYRPCQATEVTCHENRHLPGCVRCEGEFCDAHCVEVEEPEFVVHG